MDWTQVKFKVRVSSADEVGIYVKDRIRYETEVTVLLAMKVKSYPITSHETRILANRSRLVAFSMRQVHYKPLV